MSRNLAVARARRAKLAGRLGPAPVVLLLWFKADNYAWAKHFNGIGPRPSLPHHITQAEFPGFFDEMARFKMWRQRKQAGVPRPAFGLWKYGRLPEWAVVVSKAMDEAGHHAPPPQPPTPVPPPAPNPSLVARAQKVVFSAWRPSWHGRDGRLAVSADVNVAGNPSQHVTWAREAVRVGHEAGHEVAAWANQSQVGIQQLLSFGNVIDADYLIWQAETIGEMTDVGVNADGTLRPDSPVRWGDVVLIGNANSWTDKQRETVTRLIHEGKFVLIQETYTNEGDPWPVAYSTQGVPTASVSPGVGWGRYPFQLPDYFPNTPPALWSHQSPYIEETFASSSWAALPY